MQEEQLLAMKTIHFGYKHQLAQINIHIYASGRMCSLCKQNESILAQKDWTVVFLSLFVCGLYINIIVGTKHIGYIQLDEHACDMTVQCQIIFVYLRSVVLFCAKWNIVLFFALVGSVLYHCPIICLVVA